MRRPPRFREPPSELVATATARGSAGDQPFSLQEGFAKAVYASVLVEPDELAKPVAAVSMQQPPTFAECDVASANSTDSGSGGASAMAGPIGGLASATADPKPGGAVQPSIVTYF